jgi:hypothetical protein
MDLSIIIVSWNVAELLAACLTSVEEALTKTHLQVEVILVDSASSDQTVMLVREQYPWVRVFPQQENIGFTKGNNIGLEQATGRYLLLLNPDTEIFPSTLDDMVTFLDANPEVGIVGPHTLNSDHTTQSTRRIFPTKRLAFFESTWLQGYAPRHLLDQYYVADAQDDAVLDVDWVQGSALLARHTIYEQIGGLDAGYVMYFEEMDWCKRARDCGWRVVYLGTTSIIHHGGKSTDQIGARKHIYFNESKLRYFRKYHGIFFAQILRIFLLLSFLLQVIQEGAKGLIGHKRQMRFQRVQIYWQVILSGLKVT